MHRLPVIAFLAVAVTLATSHAQIRGWITRYAGAKLERWDLTRSILRECKLARTGFYRCLFDEARVERSTIKQTVLYDCDLDRCLMDDCDGSISFERSDLTSLRMERGSVRQAKAETVGVNEASAERCRIYELNWRYGEIRDVYVYYTTLSDVRLERLRINGGLSGLAEWCQIDNMRFYQTDFNRCRFDYCELSNCDFNQAKLAGVTFRYCDFSDVELQHCDISGMTIDGIDVEEAIKFYKKNK